jgi:predicted amidophosphoribosyltransferase
MKFYYRGQKCKHCREVIPVFALGHHKPESEGEDEFTKRIINFYKYGNVKEKNYFLQKFIRLYKERFEGDKKFGLICVVPTHEESGLNGHLRDFAQEFSDKIGVPYEQVIKRSKTIKPNHDLHTTGERFENVKGSIEVTDNIKGKTVVVIDNQCTTGANAQEVFDALKQAGADEVIFICFGLGSKGRESDFDINPAYSGRASEIIKKFHWPKVPKEKRRQFAEGRKDSQPDTI